MTAGTPQGATGAGGQMTVTNSSSRGDFLGEVFTTLWPQPPQRVRPWQARRQASAAPPGMAGPAAGRRRYALVPSAAAPAVAVPLRPRRGAASVLANYKASARGMARLRLRLLAALARLGAFELWPHQVVLPHPPPGAGSLETFLAGELGHDVVASVYTSPPRANRKPVLQLLDGSGRTFGYAKIGVNPLTTSLVAGEARALGEMGRRSLSSVRVPSVVFHGDWQGLEILVQSALDVTASGHAPAGVLSAAMVEVCGDPDQLTAVPAASNSYVDGLAIRLDLVKTPRGQWLRSAVVSWVAAAGVDEQLRLGAWHGDWTPWNMAYDGRDLSVWDWERYEEGVPAGYDALHCASQAVIMSREQTPGDAVAALLGQAPALLAPFGLDAAAAERVCGLYLIELGARYEGDGQEAAGARLGRLETWLLPVIADQVGLTLELVAR